MRKGGKGSTGWLPSKPLKKDEPSMCRINSLAGSARHSQGTPRSAPRNLSAMRTATFRFDFGLVMLTGCVRSVFRLCHARMLGCPGLVSKLGEVMLKHWTGGSTRSNPGFPMQPLMPGRQVVVLFVRFRVRMPLQRCLYPWLRQAPSFHEAKTRMQRRGSWPYARQVEKELSSPFTFKNFKEAHSCHSIH